MGERPAARHATRKRAVRYCRNFLDIPGNLLNLQDTKIRFISLFTKQERYEAFFLHLASGHCRPSACNPRACQGEGHPAENGGD
jgi:hypothetical protein